MRTSAGFFMPNFRTFSKIPSSYDQLLDKLAARGLLIANADSAKVHLRNIGYFRLIGYGLPFEQYGEQGNRIGQYAENTNFDSLVDIYLTDRKVSSLLLNAIERIEITTRNIINHELACKYNSAHWYMDPALFKESDDFTHASLLNEIKRHTLKNAEVGSEREGKREIFIHHYYNHYDQPEYPPCWMVAEIFPLGSWSKVYEHLSVSKDRKIISRQLDLAPATLQSWLHSITYLRNMCAHHSRLFGRKFVIRPNEAKGTPFLDENRLFNFVCIVYRLLKKINPGSNWLDAFHDELETLDSELLRHYGFSENWLEEEFWLE